MFYSTPPSLRNFIRHQSLNSKTAADIRGGSSYQLLQRSYAVLEYLAALLIAFEHIPARARGGEQYAVAALCVGGRYADRLFERVDEFVSLEAGSVAGGGNVVLRLAYEQKFFYPALKCRYPLVIA